MGDYDYKQWIPKFDLRNTSLSFLAAEAALDIDNISKGLNNEDASIFHLSGLLEGIITKEANGLLPDNALVLGYAISGRDKVEEYWKGKNFKNEISSQTSLIAKNLRDIRNLSQSQQQEMGHFCVNLSREVALYFETYYGPVHKLFAA